MTTENHTAAGIPATPLVLPLGTMIHMIAFAWHEDACWFVSMMTQRANRLRDGAACQTIVNSRERFVWAAQAQVDVLLISAHGPSTDKDAPRITDDKGSDVYLATLGTSQPFRFGARAGIIWDACYAGQPQFQKEFTRLSAPDVTHIAPRGSISWNARSLKGQSAIMGETLIDALLSPGSLAVTPASFATAAGRTAAATAAGTPGARSLDLWHGLPSGGDAS